MFAIVKTKYVCGIDLHARTMSVCVMDKNGSSLMRKSIPCKLSALLALLKPWRKDITVGVESTYNWYWLIDGLKAHDIPCLLGHALYISRMSSSKHKSDPVDAHGIAELLRVNRFPVAYDYPAEMRSTRDLLRRRHFFVRKRAGAYTHLQNSLCQQGHIQNLRAEVQRKSDRRELIKLVKDPDVQRIISSDLDYIESLDPIIDSLEKSIVAAACHHDRKHFKLLQTIPGCGPITALTVLYETHTIERFTTAQRFSSYARVVRAANESCGVSLGRSANDKIGNPNLKWAISEIAARMVNQSQPIGEWYQALRKKHGGGAMARLRHRIAVAIFQMLKKGQGFDEHKFLGTQPDRTANPAHNRKETPQRASNPSIGLIGKPSGRLKSDLKKIASAEVARIKAKFERKSPGRSPLRKNGRGKVAAKSPGRVL